MKHDLYCPTCHRYHGLTDVRHMRLLQIWERANAFKPAPVYPAGLACGDCEHMPCRCDIPTDLDLAWVPNMADHDLLPVRLEQAA